MQCTPEAFISRWNGIAGSERSNYQLFVIELCELLDLPRAQPADQNHADNAYVFERHLKEHDAEARANNRFIDCYRRGAFVLEAKSVQQNRESRGAQMALRGAHAQAQNYVRSLPATEGRPPFILVVDVGNVIEVYAEFSRSGGNYLPYPDPASHRIRITDLADDAIRKRLRAIWLDPQSLDPSRISARVTRQISVELARLARSLEAGGHDSHDVAAFLTRALFTLFAEDVGLLPKRSFTGLLEKLADQADAFVGMVEELWQKMNAGGFCAALMQKVPYFNGKFFASPTVLPLDRSQIELLLKASRADWTQVEPAIFGTLLERALDPVERHSLGAHYTPRAYVERLVIPTVIEPLRREWQNVQAAALLLDSEGKHQDARHELRLFQQRLCEIRVLDPACGSGNFLYVALEQLKRLEGEVLTQLQDLGVSASLETEGLTVDPHQFLGLEINPRAAAIAEMVLWIGYLQWHFRTRGNVLPPEPVLRDFHNIENRDAVLECDERVPELDETGQPRTRWDGLTRKIHPVTGEAVPDDSARVPLWRYVNPRQASWPEADFVVGNPPFIGTARMREALGDGYTEALRRAWPQVPDSADLVMYWWERAASLCRQGQIRQFGLITTNSLKQTFNRRVLEPHLAEGLTLAFAIPDHPWVENSDGAAVRIAMTVGRKGGGSGQLLQVLDERDDGGEDVLVQLTEASGQIHADLRIGANVASASALQANGDISERGFELGGAGFIVTLEEARQLAQADGHEDRHPLIHPYRNGRDLTDKPRSVRVIDAFGLTADKLRSQYPAVYQWLFERVKPERDNNRDEKLRMNWWLHRRLRESLRHHIAGLPRYIATVETAKHRTFQFLDADTVPDNKLVCIADSDALMLGLLSCRIHLVWALAAGSTLEDRPVYVKTTCFETFPFPLLTAEQQARNGGLAQQIDRHRKRQQALHPTLTLTGLYNVLEKLRAGTPLDAKEKVIHEHGLVAVLQTLHDELDSAVFAAYGWDDLGQKLVGQPGATTPRLDKPAEQADAEAELLLRLTQLNAARAAEEAGGLIRWLRPDYQNPQGQQQTALDQGSSEESETSKAGKPRVEKQAWPETLPEQMAALAALLDATPRSLDDIAAQFSGRGKWKTRLPALLETLAALGRAQAGMDGCWLAI